MALYMVGMIILNCNIGKYFVKMWSWGQLAPRGRENLNYIVV